MFRAASILAISLLVLGLGATASAQTKSGEKSAQPARQAWAPPSGVVESQRLIGMKVRNSEGKDIGEIDQLVVDPADGKVTHIVVGRGGMLGLGEQKVVLEWSDLKLQADPSNRSRWVAMVDQTKIDAAPRYEARRDGAPAASPATTPSGQRKP